MSDKNLALLPDYTQRINVLKQLKFVDDNGNVQLKGRVACEINSGNSLVLTELILENILTTLEPAEIVAVLSGFIFQEKTDEPVDSIVSHLPLKLQNIIAIVIDNTVRVAEVQRNAHLDVNVEDFLKETLNFGLTEVVFEWARGVAFKDITYLTDVLEGSIVRTITRLDELCRQVRDAARVIGNALLYTKMDEASECIRRDIVFAASLYV